MNMNTNKITHLYGYVIIAGFSFICDLRMNVFIGKNMLLKTNYNIGTD